MGEIDEIKERIDVVELIGESVKLRKSGKNYVGFCPFHPNTRTPAFVVFPESGTWRCFGACNEGGDAFRFVMKREGLDFPELVRHDPEVAARVELDGVFSLESYVAHVDTVLDRMRVLVAAREGAVHA